MTNFISGLNFNNDGTKMYTVKKKKLMLEKDYRKKQSDAVIEYILTNPNFSI